MDYKSRAQKAIAESKGQDKETTGERRFYRYNDNYNTINQEEIEGIAEFLKFIDQGELKFGKPRVVRVTGAELKSVKRASWGVNPNGQLVISKKEKLPVSFETFSSPISLQFHTKKTRNMWYKFGRDAQLKIFLRVLFEGLKEKAEDIRFRIYEHKNEVETKVDSLVEEFLIQQKKERSGTKSRFYRKWKNASKYPVVRKLFEFSKEEFCSLMHKIAIEKNFRHQLIKILNDVKEYPMGSFEDLSSIPDDEFLKIMRYALDNPGGIHGLAHFVERNSHDFEIVELPDIEELYDTAAAEHLINA